MPSRVKLTNPVDEYAAGRVAVFFDRSDLQYLSKHCCCQDDTDEETRNRCGRIRFRCHAAAHKLDASAHEVNPETECDFAATISLIPSDRGGRQSPFSSGYRPQLFIDNEECDIEVMLDVDQMKPGDSGTIYCRFYSSDHNLRKLVVGKPILLRDGPRTIGYGIILWRRSI